MIDNPYQQLIMAATRFEAEGDLVVGSVPSSVVNAAAALWAEREQGVDVLQGTESARGVKPL